MRGSSPRSKKGLGRRCGREGSQEPNDASLRTVRCPVELQRRRTECLATRSFGPLARSHDHDSHFIGPILTFVRPSIFLVGLGIYLDAVRVPLVALGVYHFRVRVPLVALGIYHFRVRVPLVALGIYHFRVRVPFVG